MSFWASRKRSRISNKLLEGAHCAPSISSAAFGFVIVLAHFLSVAANFHAAPLSLLIFGCIDKVENALIAGAFSHRIYFFTGQQLAAGLGNERQYVAARVQAKFQFVDVIGAAERANQLIAACVQQFQVITPNRLALDNPIERTANSAAQCLRALEILEGALDSPSAVGLLEPLR